MVEDASGRRKYVCLRCGNAFWSRAKKPQCNVCKSKRVMDYEEFLKLPEEERNKILGKRREEKKGVFEVNLEVPKVKEGENEVKGVLNPVDGKRYRLKTEEELREMKENEREAVEDGEEDVEEKPKLVKKSESPKVKSGEKEKGERVKRGISIPKPRLSLKAYAIVGGLVFAYVMYHFGWFDEVFNSLKRLGAFAKSKPEEKVESNRLLERVNKNLSG